MADIWRQGLSLRSLPIARNKTNMLLWQTFGDKARHPERSEGSDSPAEQLQNPHSGGQGRTALQPARGKLLSTCLIAAWIITQEENILVCMDFPCRWNNVLPGLESWIRTNLRTAQQQYR